MLLREEQLNSFFICTCFYCFPRAILTLTLIFRSHVSKLGKNEGKYLLYFKTLFFYLHHSEKINLLKTTDAANFEKVSKIKPYILQIKFQRNVDIIYTQKNYRSRLFLFLFLFFLCFFFCLCFYEKASG